MSVQPTPIPRKVLILGGYGVFGSRLARLLVRDGHHVCIAGRSLPAAQNLASELGCTAMRLDRNQALDPIADFDVVVDAAGPFHSYGNDPYRLPRAAIKAGAHYLDLSDNADFCAGITILDTDAKAAGVCALSGLSSVPALSSAAVRALIGDDQPQLINSAILPGNRSPRGLSVMASIIPQAGQSMQVWRGGEWVTETCWSSPRTYQLPGGEHRQAWQIEVPDQRLFPDHFKADSVIFRAGLELSIMRYGLAGFAQLRRLIPFPVSQPLVKLFKLAADALTPFGTGRGGMVVEVAVGNEHRSWRLLVEDGDGPFIPAIATRALLRRDTLPIGARPALEAVTLSEAEAAMADLNTRTDRDTAPFRPLFQQVLGDDFDTLPPQLRATHQTVDRQRLNGRASITRGDGWWPWLIATLFRFPPASADIDVDVVKTVTSTGETWLRRFGPHRFRSNLTATPQGMTERFGPMTFLLGLKVDNSKLYYPVRSGRMGPIPLPRWLLPVSEAAEYVENGEFHFDVKLLAPITQQLIVHYRGCLQPAT